MPHFTKKIIPFTFQYLGSQGAQPQSYALLSSRSRFNTWAREEPNDLSQKYKEAL